MKYKLEIIIFGKNKTRRYTTMETPLAKGEKISDVKEELKKLNNDHVSFFVHTTAGTIFIKHSVQDFDIIFKEVI